ncbi:MAG TPA: methyltransferase domain-containing protein [Hanamia sp.]|nr:methyltransferase domain-containing protein [Hanamia sp.]
MKDWFADDLNFNALYPLPIRAVAEKHWTPIEVAIKAAAFLAVSPEEKVLDIGSGSGKFCLTAAHFHPQTDFYGIEQRPDLVNLCNDLKERLKITNVSFICDNIINLNFKNYDHFYFYNSFYENIEGTQKIDYNVAYSERLYDAYNRYLYRQLNKKPSGTRLVTYHSFGSEIPKEYEVVQTAYEDYLKFWIKV